VAATHPNTTEAYEKILTANLQRTLDFLKFAEAKNAAMLALASGWLFAIINVETNGKNVPTGLTVGMTLALPLALLAGLLAMFSFLPRLHLPSFLGGRRAGPHPKNLLYFGDISTLSIKTLERDLRDRYFSSSTLHTDDYIHDLIVQISVNSEITLRKMRLFKIGMWLIVAAGIALLIPILQLAIRGVTSLW
jgi:Family of unknown function (DUF5706)